MAHKFMLSLNILQLLLLSIFKKLQIVKSNTDFGYSVMYWANETIDVPEFFKTTYIEIVKGKWDPKKNIINMIVLKTIGKYIIFTTYARKEATMV